MKRYLMICAGITSLLIAGFFIYQLFFRAVKAEAQTFPDAVSEQQSAQIGAEGQIIPLRQAQLAFQKSGVVTEILVVEGELVTAMQPLARLDTAELTNALTQADATLARAEAAQMAAQAQLAAAQADVQIATVGLEVAQATLALTTAMPSTEEVALQEAVIAVTMARTYQASADQAISLSGATAAEIEAAKADVAAAAAQERVLQDEYDALIRNESLGTPEEHARFALNAAEAQLEAAQTRLDLLMAGPNAAQQNAAQSGGSIASAEQEVAQQQLALLMAGPRPEAIAVAQAGVAQAEANLQRAQTAVGQAEAAVVEAEAAVQEVQAAREAVQIALDKMTLYAPFAGTIANLDMELGEVMAMGTSVVTLADLSSWLVETEDLTELDVVSIGVGEAVDVHIDSMPDVTLQGTIREISPESTLTLGDVTYTVVIELIKAEALPLRWGMSTFVDIEPVK